MSKPQEPRIGAWMDRWHRYGWRGEDGIEHYPLMSVTSALQVIEKPALPRWSANTVARYAIDNRHLLDREDAYDVLRKAPERERERSASFGTVVHKLIDAHTSGYGEEPGPDTDERLFLTAWRSFVMEYEPQFLTTESMVFNLTHGYAGKFDATAWIDGSLYLLDYKTGNAIYPETELQLAGYAAAEFIGRENDTRKYPLPPFEKYAVVHIRPEVFDGGYPEGYRFVEYDVTDESKALFLHALPLRRWASTKEKEWRESRKEKAA